MLAHWEAAASSPIPPPVKANKTKLKKHLMDKNRHFTATSPGRSRTKVITSHAEGVLGHHPSASTHFNTTGHTQARRLNALHNRQTHAYHGIEDRAWSDASGASEPRYLSPAPHLGSHPSYYQPGSTGFTGGPWSTYVPQGAADIINYIEGKLQNLSSSDPEYKQAMANLAQLKTTYSEALAQKLLRLINRHKL